jgi:hypothetical protein
VLLNECDWLEKHLAADTYQQNYKRRVNNSIYKPLIDELLRTTSWDRKPGRSEHRPEP